MGQAAEKVSKAVVFLRSDRRLSPPALDLLDLHLFPLQECLVRRRLVSEHFRSHQWHALSGRCGHRKVRRRWRPHGLVRFDVRGPRLTDPGFPPPPLTRFAFSTRAKFLRTPFSLLTLFHRFRLSYLCEGLSCFRSPLRCDFFCLSTLSP